jgi:hypothetical protein
MESCLETAMNVCAADAKCQALSFTPNWGARLYETYEAHMLSSNYQWDTHVKFCHGCTDESATNYHDRATHDDDSCTHVEGCTDPTDPNFDATATVHIAFACANQPEPEPEPPTSLVSEGAAEGGCSAEEVEQMGQRLTSLLGNADCLEAVAATRAGPLDPAAPIAAGCSEGRVISDCHFPVPLNHFIPGFLSYSVAVFRN